MPKQNLDCRMAGTAKPAPLFVMLYDRDAIRCEQVNIVVFPAELLAGPTCLHGYHDVTRPPSPQHVSLSV